MAQNNLFYLRYRDNLRKCLEYLTNTPKLKTAIDPTVISKIKSTTQQLSSGSGLKCFDISLDPFEVKANDLMNCKHFPAAFLSIGGEVKFGDGGSFYQALSVCLITEPSGDVTADDGYSLCRMDNGKSYIVRRFHFDIDATQINGDRPVFHLQYGGNIKDQQKSKHQYELISSIDLPRIPTMPLDLIQAMNVLFSQINTDIISSFQNPRWRSIVLENDEIWDDIYFSAIKNRGGKQTLYEKLCTHNVFG